MEKTTESYTTEQTIIVDILDKYKNSPYLWDPSHRLYKNKDVRQQAWEILLEKWKNVDSNATVDSLKKKIENWRATFNREWKKVEHSKALGDKDIYVPSLWYYKHLTFLYENQQVQSSTKKTEVDSIKKNKDFQEPEKERKVKVKKRCLSDLQKKQEQLIDTALNLLSPEDDSSDSFARAMGLQLKEMSKLQRCIAEKLISEVMFYGKLNQLTLQSNINVRCDSSDSHAVPSPSCYKPIPNHYSP